MFATLVAQGRLNAIGEQLCLREIPGARKPGGGGSRVHKRKPMLGVKMVEIDRPAPLRKRERWSLSAKDAYNAIALWFKLDGHLLPKLQAFCGQTRS